MARGAQAATACGLVGLLIVQLFAAGYAAAYGETTLLGFTFRFEGVEYDPAADTSVWTYTVTGPGVDGPQFKDLSHWIMALCPQHTVLKASGRWERSAKPDPHHGLVGIKWDEEVSKTGSRTFYFVLQGRWAVDAAVQIGVKAGTATASDVLPGPACRVDVCRVDYAVTTRSDWHFLKPGVYAAPALHVQLTGDGAVLLRFSGFGDAYYVADPGLSPPVVFEYSVGPTLDAAEALGWHTADQFNDLEVVVPRDAVRAGATVTVWLKALVTEAHRSSDYAGGGRVGIEPVCD